MSDTQHYAEMKDSGIKWIGRVPAGWSVRTLYQLATRVNNKNADLAEQNLLSLSYGKIKRKDINTSDGLLPASFDGYNIIEAGDIVLRLTDLQNDHTSLRVGHVTEKGIITSAYTTLRPINPAHSRYLYYLIHAFDLKKGFYGMGSGVRQGLNYDEVKELRVVLPPQEEQNAIVTFLDEQCGKIDEQVSDARTSINMFADWRVAVISEIMTRGINCGTNLKDSGVQWIGQIPDTWSLCALKYLTSKIGSGKTPRGGAEVYTSEGVIFLRSQNIYDTGLVLDDVSHISEKTDMEMRNTRVFYNDVLLNITGGSIGRCCVYDLVDTHANVNQHVCILRPLTDKLLPNFLRYFWNSCYGSITVALHQTGGNRAGLNFEQIGNTRIPLCPIEEQEKIVEFLNKKCSLIDSLVCKKQTLISDLEQYKRSLIYETVTGKRKVV